MRLGSLLSRVVTPDSGRRITKSLTTVLLLLLPALMPTASAQTSNTAAGAIPAQGIALYRQLRSVGLDAQNVYRVRGAAIDREDLHLSFTDGIIAFLAPVNGRITGAVFAGEGGILLIPPNQVERQSLALFTKAAVLNESFAVAYFRFADEKFMDDLRPALRAVDPDTSAEFVQQRGAMAKALADADALRTLMALTHEASTNQEAKSPSGNFIRGYLSGRLGTFDVSFDTLSSEQISVSQPSYSEKGRFYDLWTSFPMRSAREPAQDAKSSLAGIVAHEPFVITDYDIHAQVRPPTDLAAETTLTLDIRSPGDRTLIFELSRYLKVSAVTLATSGARLAVEFIQNEAIEGSQLSRRGNDVVAVLLPQPLASGKVKLKFSYAGAVLADAGGGLLYVGARGTWYPNLGPAMSNFNFEFQYPAEWKLLVTGKLLSRTASADGPEVSRWRSEQPIPLAGFNIGRYSAFSATSKAESGNVVIETFATRAMENTFTAHQRALAPPPLPSSRLRPPNPLDVFPPSVMAPDPAHNALSVAEQSARTIDFLAPRLGRFPYTALSLTQRPGPDSQGWPGLVFLSSYVFLTAQERASQVRRNPNAAYQILYDRVMVAHETAHQWWGDAVFYQDYRSQWIIEALANYCALMQLETEHPDQFKTMMEAYRGELQESDPSGRRIMEAGPVSLGLRLNSSQLPNAFESVVYGRGTWLIHMLRYMFRDGADMGSAPLSRASARAKKTGRKLSEPDTKSTASKSGAKSDPDARFFSVLRQLQEKLHGRLISNAELKSAFEGVMPAWSRFEGKKSLDWFFDGWVDGTALPHYQLDEVKFSASGGKTVAQALLHQQEAPESLVTSLPIYATTASGQVVFVDRVFADGEETAIKLTVPRGTKSLLIDPYQTVLSAK